MRRFGSAAIATRHAAVTVSLVGRDHRPFTRRPPQMRADAAVPGAMFFAKLHAVSASSSTDAWAVGYRTAPGASTTRPHQALGWPAVDDGAVAFTPARTASSGASRTSPRPTPGPWVRCLGERYRSSLSSSIGTVPRWQLVPLHGGPGLGKLTAISAIGPDDIWMVGTDYATRRADRADLHRALGRYMRSIG